MNWLLAILRLRCSHCRKGPVYKSWGRMNETCPHCGIHFEREQGYWMMSVFIGYVMYFVILGPLSLVLYLQQTPFITLMFLDGVLIFLLALPIFIYARVIWLYIDELLDPRTEEPANPPDFLTPAADNPDSNK